MNPASKQKHIIKILKSHITRTRFAAARYKDRESIQELKDSEELLDYLESLWGRYNK